MKKKENIIDIENYLQKDCGDDKKDFHAIIANILNKLTGDEEKDFNFLRLQWYMCEKHKFVDEIREELFNIMAKKYPNMLSKEIKKMNNFYDSIYMTLDLVDLYIYKFERRKAYDLIKPIVRLAKESVEDDEVKANDKKIFTFSSFLEEKVFMLNNNGFKNFKSSKIPYSEIYFKYGCILEEMGELNSAKKYFEEALIYNPSDTESAFQIVEIYKTKKDFENMYKKLNETIKICYKDYDVARYYRGLGYYYAEKKEYKLAYICYIKSLHFDKKTKVPSTDMEFLNYCKDEEINELNSMTKEEVDNYCKKYNIPIEEDLKTYNTIYMLYIGALRNPFNEDTTMIIEDYSHCLRDEERPIVEKLERKIAIVYNNLQEMANGNKLNLKYKTIQFGKTAQFNIDLKGEDIDWFVLEEDDDKMLLMSKYILGAKEYNDSEDCSWEKSSLRKYLNGEFIKECFSKDEAKKIIKTKLDNSEKSIWEIDNCKETEDYVFCLSMSEIEKYFPDEYDTLKYKEIVNQSYYINTKLATFANYKSIYEFKLFVNDDEDKWYFGNSYFWTRSISKNNKKVIVINEDGSANNGFDNNTIQGLRPVMWIKK